MELVYYISYCLLYVLLEFLRQRLFATGLVAELLAAAPASRASPPGASPQQAVATEGRPLKGRAAGAAGLEADRDGPAAQRFGRFGHLSLLSKPFLDASYMPLGPVEVQLRAHIFLQSVNVIRNMDYLARCIKTEVQRLATDKKARRAQLPKSLAASGLQLLCPDLAMRKPCF